LDGLTSSSNLTFFSELKKPKLGELGSLNLNVLGASFSCWYGKLLAFISCKSESALTFKLLALPGVEYLSEFACPFEV
jgi:hypothetical protein